MSDEQRRLMVVTITHRTVVYAANEAEAIDAARESIGNEDPDGYTVEELVALPKGWDRGSYPWTSWRAKLPADKSVGELMEEQGR